MKKKQPQQPPATLTVEQFAALHNVAERTAQAWCASPAGVAAGVVRIGGKRYDYAIPPHAPYTKGRAGRPTKAEARTRWLARLAVGDAVMLRVTGAEWARVVTAADGRRIEVETTDGVARFSRVTGRETKLGARWIEPVRKEGEK